MKKITALISLLLVIVIAGCGNSAARAEEASKQKKEVYEQLKNIMMSGTTEMTYYILAWDLVEKTPDLDTLDPQSVVNLYASSWNKFLKTLSVLDIEVTYDDVIEALTYYEGEDAKKLKDTDILGVMLVTEKQYAVEVAKYIYEKYNPLKISTDYKRDLEKVSSDLSDLSYLKDDEEYALLMDLYEKGTSMSDDISSAPSGTYEEHCKRLEEYRNLSLKCNEIFSEEDSK